MLRNVSGSRPYCLLLFFYHTVLPYSNSRDVIRQYGYERNLTVVRQVYSCLMCPKTLMTSPVVVTPSLTLLTAT